MRKFQILQNRFWKKQEFNFEALRFELAMLKEKRRIEKVASQNFSKHFEFEAYKKLIDQKKKQE